MLKISAAIGAGALLVAALTASPAQAATATEAPQWHSPAEWQVGLMLTDLRGRLQTAVRAERAAATDGAKVPGLAYRPRIKTTMTAQDRAVLDFGSLTDRNHDGYDDDRKIAFALSITGEGDPQWGACMDLRTGVVAAGNCRDAAAPLPRPNLDHAAEMLVQRMTFFDADTRWGRGAFGVDSRDLEKIQAVVATDLPTQIELVAYDTDGDGLVDGHTASHGADDIKAFVWLRNLSSGRCAEVGLPVSVSDKSYEYTSVWDPNFDCALIPAPPADPAPAA